MCHKNSSTGRSQCVRVKHRKRYDLKSRLLITQKDTKHFFDMRSEKRNVIASNRVCDGIGHSYQQQQSPYQLCKQMFLCWCKGFFLSFFSLASTMMARRRVVDKKETMRRNNAGRFYGDGKESPTRDNATREVNGNLSSLRVAVRCVKLSRGIERC
jgi:hypothetical protein